MNPILLSLNHRRVMLEQCLSGRAVLLLGFLLASTGALAQPGGQASVRAAGQTQERWSAISNRWSKLAVSQVRRAAADGEANAQCFLAWTLENGVGVAKNDAEAVEWFRRSADLGHAEAQMHLAQRYSLGRGVPQDHREAARLLRLAAEQGHAMAQNNLGHLHAQGLGVAKDPVQAVHWYRRSAELGEAYGQANLGWMYKNGVGVQSNPGEAEKWLGRAAEQGLPQAQFLMGTIAESSIPGYSIRGNFVLAAEWFEKAAMQGHMEAMFHLGDLYYYGNLGHDYGKAINWLRQAAEKGHLKAAYRLGELYRQNRGGSFPANHAEAIRWFRAAADQNDAKAQFQVALLLLEGQGVRHDQAEAELWLQRASANGYTEAAIKLASLSQPSAEAAPLESNRRELEIAASTGDGGRARLLLGIAYEEGKGGAPDPRRAAGVYAWILNNGAPAQEYSEALHRLIGLYARGRVAPEPFGQTDSSRLQSRDGYLFFLPREPGQLAALLKQNRQRVTAAKALCQVGELFHRGEAVPEDWSAALDWYTRAAQAGSAAAMYAIGKMWAEGVNGEPDPEEACRWYRQAAGRGLSDAQYALGMGYAKGEGVANDLIEAWRWLQAAAVQTHAHATIERDKVQQRLTAAQLAEARKRLAESGPAVRGAVEAN